MERMVILFTFLMAMEATAQRDAREVPLAGKVHHALSAHQPSQHNPETIVKNTAHYAVKPVSFNSSGMDFSPFIFENGIVFVSSRPTKGNTNTDFLSLFYVEEYEDGNFSDAEPLHGGDVTARHEGPAVFFDSGNKKILSRNSMIKKSRMKDGSENMLELAFSERTPSGKWSDPVTLPFASSEYSVAHPAISRDGRTLYFSSNMPGTLGESDIFVSRFENGVWSAPRNLGSTVNSPGKELFPFLSNDSILFFASNGQGGHGGLDIFFYDLRDGDPILSSFESPINTDSDDFGIYVEEGGTSGFFSSNRSDGDDIYYFELMRQFAEIQVFDSITQYLVRGADIKAQAGDHLTAQTTSDFAGKAEFLVDTRQAYRISISASGYTPSEMILSPSSASQKQPLKLKASLAPRHKHIGKSFAAGLHTRDRATITNTITFSSSPLDIDLNAEVPSPPDTAVATAVDSVFLPRLKVIVVEVINDLPAVFMVKNDSIFELRPVSPSALMSSDERLKIEIPRGAKRNDYEDAIAGQVRAQGYDIERYLLIRSFFFDTGKTWIRNDASAQLDKIIEVLHAFPHLDVQMIFHADSRGTEGFNLDLSKARSEEVKNYLLRAGIQKTRVVSEFVGESKLLNDCGDLADCDELLHQMNRTAEFKFIMR